MLSTIFNTSTRVTIPYHMPCVKRD